MKKLVSILILAICLTSASAGTMTWHGTTRKTEQPAIWLLSTNGTAAAPGVAFFQDQDTGMFRTATNALGFSTGGTVRMEIDASGNIIIASTTTLSPSDISFLDALIARTLTVAGTAAEITVVGGAQDLAGNRTWTISLPNALTFTGKTVTGGTFSSITLSGTPIYPDGTIARADLADSSALSVIGRSANSTGVPADIAAGTDGFVLRRSGTTLGFGTIATAGITDAAVTLAKMADLATQRVIGRNTGSTGVPESVTATQILDWIGSTRGSILYRGASGWAILTPGASGHALLSQGAGADPIYGAVSGSQTPWTQNIDGGGFNLSNVGTLTATDFNVGTLTVTNRTQSLDALFGVVEGTIASATTTDIGAVTNININVTGTTPITGLGTVTAGTWRRLRFSGALTFTHNATSLILPNNGSNITTANGDTCVAVSLGSGNWRIYDYTKANGHALVDDTGGGGGLTGTVINSGASIAGAIPTYADTTGTNATPSTVTVSASTNLNTGSLVVSNANRQITVAGNAMTFPSTAATIARADGNYRNIWLDAGAAVPTNSAMGGTWTVGSQGIQRDVMDFDGGTAVEQVSWALAMPDTWDLGTVKFKVFWTGAAGAGDVKFSIAAGAISNDDPAGSGTSILGTAQTATDTFIAADDVHVTPATAALTVGGTPALGDWIVIRLLRDPTDGADTKTQDARVVGIQMQYLESTTEPVIW